MTRSNPEDDGVSVPFINAWSGHWIVSALTIPLIAVMLGIYLWISGTHVIISDLVISLFLIITADSFFVSLLERPTVMRAGHPAPGGWKYALPSFVCPPVISLFFGLAFEREWFLPFTLGTSVPILVLQLFIQPWKKGIDRRQFRENMRKTQDFIDNKRLENGWTPEVKAVKDRRNKTS